MEYELIKVNRNGHRYEIKLNNPPVNVLNERMMREIIDALEHCIKESTARIIVFKGEGKAWSAGADVSEHLPGKYLEMLDVFGRLCNLTRTIQLPTVALVNGLCLGGGCELAMMCDFIIASEQAKFGQPEVKVGVIPPVACALFASRIGWRNAMDLIMTGRIISADEASAMGIAHKVFNSEEYEAKSEEFISRIIENSGAVLRCAKMASVKSMLGYDEAIREIMRIYSEELMTKKDAIEGLTAFLEKRPAVWGDE